MIGFGQFCRWLAIVLAVALTSTATCLAQEVGFVDLTQIVPRMDLRRPPPRNDEVIGRRGGIHEIHICDRSTKHAGAGAVRTTLVWLDRSECAVGDLQKFEVRIENIGSAPIKIPFSPHLADLQPKDPRQKFRYSELWVQLWIEGGEKWSASTGAAVTLYGTSEHPDTMLTLQPGEWSRIIGEGTVTLPEADLPRATGAAVSHANAKASIYESEALLTALTTATVSHGLCFDESQGPEVAMRLLAPKQ